MLRNILDVTPDLVTFGKILGGGFPIGAISGKKELMEMIAPSGSVYQAGTLMVILFLLLRVLQLLKRLESSFYSEMNSKGNKFKERDTGCSRR